MTEAATSRNAVSVRLTDERWAHIVEEHCELAGLRAEVLQTVSDAERVLAGRVGELLALRQLDPHTTLVVVYKEVTPQDGFVIPAFLTTRPGRLERRQPVWPPPK